MPLTTQTSVIEKLLGKIGKEISYFIQNHAALMGV